MDLYLKHILLFYPLIKNSKKKKLFIHINTAYFKVHHSFAHFYLQYIYQSFPIHMSKGHYINIKVLKKVQIIMGYRVHIYIMKTIY